MLKVYGSPLCPDCEALLQGLKEGNAPCEFIDITASMASLREFLALRDSREEFRKVREAHLVGIPALVEDGVLSLDYEAYLRKKGIEKAEGKKSCSLDGRGC